LVGFQPLVLWQLTQLALVGMWDATLPVAPLPRLAQLVALLKPLWSGFAPPSQLLVDLWQFSHTVMPLWIAVAGRAVRPKLLFKWQVPHWLVTCTLAWKAPGFQLEKPPL
jgi:hypothetical protein